MTKKESIKYSCFICSREYEMGFGSYEGKYIRWYDINVCKICYDGNRDGWNPGYEKKLIAHLNEKGLPVPERNEKGLLPRY